MVTELYYAQCLGHTLSHCIKRGTIWRTKNWALIITHRYTYPNLTTVHMLQFVSWLKESIRRVEPLIEWGSVTGMLRKSTFFSRSCTYISDELKNLENSWVYIMTNIYLKTNRYSPGYVKPPRVLLTRTNFLGCLLCHFEATIVR